MTPPWRDAALEACFIHIARDGVCSAVDAKVENINLIQKQLSPPGKRSEQRIVWISEVFDVLNKVKMDLDIVVGVSHHHAVEQPVVTESNARDQDNMQEDLKKFFGLVWHHSMMRPVPMARLPIVLPPHLARHRENLPDLPVEPVGFEYGALRDWARMLGKVLPPPSRGMIPPAKNTPFRCPSAVPEVRPNDAPSFALAWGGDDHAFKLYAPEPAVRSRVHAVAAGDPPVAAVRRVHFADEFPVPVREEVGVPKRHDGPAALGIAGICAPGAPAGSVELPGMRVEEEDEEDVPAIISVRLPEDDEVGDVFSQGGMEGDDVGDEVLPCDDVYEAGLQYLT